MKLIQEILAKALEEEVNISFLNLETNIKEIIETKCYKALQKIKIIIEDDSINDFECIEKIVCIFEEIGSNGGNRHDFG